MSDFPSHVKTIMVTSLTTDIEINTTANYTLEETALVHMSRANGIFKLCLLLIPWHPSEK